jgi:hypothetical protein
MATRNDFRAGDAEREAVAAQLREHFAHGRLSLDELQDRLDAAFAARMMSDLDRVVSDLPHVSPPPASMPAAGGASLGTEQPGWQGGHQRHRPGPANLAARFATVAMIVVVVACLLLVNAWYTHGGAGASFAHSASSFFRRWLPVPPWLVFALGVLAALRGLRGRIFGRRRRRR